MKKKKKIPVALKWLIFLGVVLLILGTVYVVQTMNNKAALTIDKQQAQALVDNVIEENLREPTARGADYVFDNTTIKVVDVIPGDNREFVFRCEYTTCSVGDMIEKNLNKYLSNAYGLYLKNEENGTMTNATKVMLEVSKPFKKDMEGTQKVSGTIDFYWYESDDGKAVPYLSYDFVNTAFGGILDAKKAVSTIDEIDYNGTKVDISKLNTLRNGVIDCFELRNYETSKPDTSIPLIRFFNEIKDDFILNFIHKDQYMFIVNGLITTLEITFLAVLLGIVIGFMVAVIRVTNQKTGKLGIASSICKGYLSIMRGTPVMVQLLIIYFVLLLPIGVEKFPAAVLCFGLNSGAYVSEIVRGGIVSVDAGQTEAGRSLGFNYIQTMWYIVIPQAFKAVLPSLANEFITLLKESSVAFYIGVADLTQGGIKIRSITYSNFMPLIAVALIYLILVLGLTKCVGILERRLQKGDKG